MIHKKIDGWGGRRDPKKRKGGLKGRRCTHANHIKLMYDMQFKKPFNMNGWRPQVYRSHPMCPRCDNNDGELITELRESFFKCELCKYHWDIEMEP